VNHYPRHIGDWMRDTVHLSEQQECLYLRLIDQYYAREKPLPTDVEACNRLARASTTYSRQLVSALLKEFFHLEPDGWHHKRCDIELDAYHAKSESARKSAKIRWSERNANASANASDPQSVGNANQNQNQNHIKPKPKTIGEATLPEGVSTKLWQAFTKHRTRLKAPLTDEAGYLIITKLKKLATDGFNPVAVIEQSMERGWKGVFPIDNQGASSNGHQPKYESRIAEQERVASALTGYKPKARTSSSG